MRARRRHESIRICACMYVHNLAVSLGETAIGTSLARATLHTDGGSNVDKNDGTLLADDLSSSRCWWRCLKSRI
jgi:hypothetical protein